MPSFLFLFLFFFLCPLHLLLCIPNLLAPPHPPSWKEEVLAVQQNKNVWMTFPWNYLPASWWQCMQYSLAHHGQFPSLEWPKPWAMADQFLHTIPLFHVTHKNSANNKRNSEIKLFIFKSQKALHQHLLPGVFCFSSMQHMHLRLQLSPTISHFSLVSCLLLLSFYKCNNIINDDFIFHRNPRNIVWWRIMCRNSFSISLHVQKWRSVSNLVFQSNYSKEI